MNLRDLHCNFASVKVAPRRDINADRISYFFYVFIDIYLKYSLIEPECTDVEGPPLLVDITPLHCMQQIHLCQ